VEPIVVATWGLVVATAILAVINVLQFRNIRSQARRTEQVDAAQMALLLGQTNALAASAQAANASAAALNASAQAAQAMAAATNASAEAANASASALGASAQATQAMAQAAAADAQASQAMAEGMTRSAAATQAMAAEMLEARRAANPLELRIEQRDKHGGVLDAIVYNIGGRAAVIQRTEIESNGLTSGDNWGNVYLAPGGRGQPIRYPYDTSHGDLVTLRLTGRPSDGLEQTREYLFRIQPDGTLEDLDTKHWAPSDRPGGAIT
jgi:hypothetical protein